MPGQPSRGKIEKRLFRHGERRIFRQRTHSLPPNFRMIRMKTLAKVVLATAVAALATPAFAQDTVGTLSVNQGTVMTSTGGEFASASSGEAIQAGERIMVGESSSASVTFTNGAVVNYTAPGVYTVQVPVAGTPVATSGGASSAATVGIVLGAAVLGAAAIESMGDDTPPDHPVSR
jgi:hypothetical protein